MALNLALPQKQPDLKPKIVVLGVGGAGGNAVNTMIQSELQGVDFAVCNTDAQALTQSAAPVKIQLGSDVTRGLGAGSKPDVGAAAAKESLAEVLANVEDANLVFIAAGMGGGTGTGAAPVIAKAIRDLGILTVAVVTKPFRFEGAHRMSLADEGIEQLQQAVDTLITIPNQNLFRVANERTTFADAFKMADDVLYEGVRGISDLMVQPGTINLDFADVRALMTVMGKAMMGLGEAEGECRAIEAAEAAIANPLLEDADMAGAKGVLINIAGGQDLTLFEVDEAANRVREEVDPAANIIFGSSYDPELQGRIRISIVATGIQSGIVRNAVTPQSSLDMATSDTQTAPDAQAPQVASSDWFDEPQPVLQSDFHKDQPQAQPLSQSTPTVASVQTPKPQPTAHQGIAHSAVKPTVNSMIGSTLSSSTSPFGQVQQQAETNQVSPEHLNQTSQRSAAPTPFAIAPLATPPSPPGFKSGETLRQAIDARHKYDTRLKTPVPPTPPAPPVAATTDFGISEQPSFWHDEAEINLPRPPAGQSNIGLVAERPVATSSKQHQPGFVGSSRLFSKLQKFTKVGLGSKSESTGPALSSASTGQPKSPTLDLFNQPVSRVDEQAVTPHQHVDEDLLEIPAFLRRQAN